MITEEHVERLFDRANPVPDPELLDLEQIGAARHLATFEQRSSEVTQLDTRPTESKEPKRGRFVLAMGTAAAILIAAVLVLTQSDETPPPATQPTPTTIAAPVTTAPQGDEVALATAEEFMMARDSWDGEGIRALLSDDATIVGTEFAEVIDEYPALADYERAVGARFLDHECLVSSPGLIRCTYLLENKLTQAAGAGPFVGNSFMLEFEDGMIQRINHIFGAPTSMAVVEEFTAWLGANYPDDVSVMYVASASGGDQFASITPESIALWETHVEEYLAEQAG